MTNFRTDIINLATNEVVAELLTGQTIAPMPYPWNVKVTNLSVPAGHGWNFVSQVDNSTAVVLQNFEYLFAHRSPLNLSNGSHTLTFNDGNAANTTTVQFTISPPPTSLPFFSGGNLVAVDDPFLTEHRSALLTYQSLSGRNALRAWHEGAWTTLMPVSYYAPLCSYPGNRFIVANAQNSSPRCSCPPIGQFLKWMSNLPSGIFLCCLNEWNTATYYTGTQAQYLALVKEAYPLAKSLGIQFVSGSVLSTGDYTTFIKQAIDAGIYEYCDYADYHDYGSSAAQTIERSLAVQELLKPTGKPMIMTEWGTRPADHSTWAAQQVQVMADLEKANIPNLSFPTYIIPGNSDTASPFLTNGQKQQPFYDAYVSARQINQ